MGWPPEPDCLRHHLQIHPQGASGRRTALLGRPRGGFPPSLCTSVCTCVTHSCTPFAPNSVAARTLVGPAAASSLPRDTLHWAPFPFALGRGKGPQRRPQERISRRLAEVAKAVGGGYCRLQMPLRLALGVRGTVAGHRLGALEEGGGGGCLPPRPSTPATPPRRGAQLNSDCHPFSPVPEYPWLKWRRFW